jgi:(5-formylfuran-3-yl)methyl phosphate synthase
MIGTAEGPPRFLVSVRSADEARIALAGGADIIDAKEPRGGALGSVTLGTLLAIVQAVDVGRPVSATIGDCACEDAAERVEATARSGVDYVKIGLFDAPSGSALKALEACAAKGIRQIAVIFADRDPDLALIKPLAEAGFVGVMLDTAEKTKGLRAHMGEAALAGFLAQARRYGLLAGLAGSLSEADASALRSLRPDVLGFRGALCASGARGERLELQRVKAMRRLIGAELAAGVA